MRRIIYMACISENAKNYIERFNSIFCTMKEKMNAARQNDSISYDFITRMVPHHEAAIEMSENILKYTTCVPLEKIAEGIIKEQKEGIERMRKIMDSCSQTENCENDLICYDRKIDRIMDEMFKKMGSVCPSDDLNSLFMREMIPHHEGAVKMCETALCYPICDCLKPILLNIIAEQKKGISEMRCLLAKK